MYLTVIFVADVIAYATHLGESRLFQPNGTMYPLHFTLLELCVGCATVNISQSVRVFWALKFVGCYLPWVLLGYLRLAWSQQLLIILMV